MTLTNKEIDCQIAQKVMGWSETPERPNFAPSERIEDAWKVVSMLKEEQYYFKLENGDFYDYECQFTAYEGTKTHSAEHDEAPMAICLAALKAKSATKS